ncbi:LysR family transcriptional regulator [Phytoactinopolyspora halotolerans]|uniref:LysR family transcriptional regulator n=1 Tax=Phytoactinopolyspora halotolerans TaxID=1981512 RepID=A0A6L9SFW3_9ACTN|nr:LysR family transcriptional regulator [Phytoactinopolyspora halotolerans]NEE03989.1 LysR family transcriptional regulator [Phytoactinopolyspora halotolerans]
MLDPHRLRVFRAVVATGSVHQAATNLGYTPSAVSQHLTALQRETGLRLVERNGRGIEPTATGRMLADEAAAALERLAELDAVVTDLREGRVGTLSISYFASAGAAWIPPVVAALTREFPELRIDLRLIELADEHKSAPDVEIFVEGAESGPIQGYDVYPLLEEPYVAVLPETHPLAGRRSIPLRELADEPWVDNDFSRGPCRQALLDACSAVGVSPGFHVETHDYPTAISFVAAGVGITVLPRLGVGTLPAGLVAVPVVDPVPVRRISVRVRESLRRNPAARRIVELLHARVDANEIDPVPEPALTAVTEPA